MTGGATGASARRPLGNSDLTVSPIGLGCARLGAFWQGRSPRAGLQSLQTAIELGMTLIDTADCYARGISERLVGRAARYESDLVISTKVGLLKTPIAQASARRHGRVTDKLTSRADGGTVYQSFSSGYVRAAAHRSLRRLRRDQIELLVLHEPSAESLRRADAVAALERLRDDGDIRAFGVCCTSLEAAHAALALPGICCLQVPANIRSLALVDGIADKARAQDVSLIGIAVLGDGQLLSAFPPAEKGLALRGCLTGLLEDSRLTSILVGASSPEHVRGILAAADAPLNPEERERLHQRLEQLC